jgi:bromodomain and WD repeat domain-containing protein 1/3
VDNRFYRRIDAILFDLKFIYENAASFNLPKSDIVKNAKIIWQTASDIIKSPLKTKDDVSAVYHRFVETFEWSQSDSSDSDEKEESPNQGRGLRHQKISKKQDPLNPKQWKRDCNDLLNDMFKHPLSDPFREPVSEIEYPDYHRIVSTPMDLTMVRESLHSGEYDTPTELQKDIQLIFKNSRTYNTNSRSKVWTMTTKLEEWFEKRMMKLLYEWRKTKRKIAVVK